MAEMQLVTQPIAHSYQHTELWLYNYVRLRLHRCIIYYSELPPPTTTTTPPPPLTIYPRDMLLIRNCILLFKMFYRS